MPGTVLVPGDITQPQEANKLVGKAVKWTYNIYSAW